MTFTLLVLIAGALLIVMALSGTVLTRLPLTTALVYLAVGAVLGSDAIDLLTLDVVDDALLVERLTELVVVISLFTAGLKLRVPWTDPLWRVPIRLASGAMVLTVALIALVGLTGLGLSLGAAVLLGAILAPTDPVLASDVQVTHPQDRDRLRFGLTGEAGLNDGTAFPFVMLGLGLLGHHDLGTFGWRWLAVDLVWATGAGLAIGAGLGAIVGRLVLFLRREHREAVGLDEFLTLGLIALAYGSAILVHAYGFLAVFAAGLALRRIEQRTTGDALDAVTASIESGDATVVAVDPETAPAYMARAVLGFNEQLERIGEVAIVVLVGVLLAGNVTIDAVWFVPVLFLMIRPLAVLLGLWGTSTPRTQRRFMGWFGIRGIGSLYYLSFAITHGLDDALAQRLTEITLSVIVVSVVIHGISVTPLMARYERTLIPRTRRVRTSDRAS